MGTLTIVNRVWHAATRLSVDIAHILFQRCPRHTACGRWNRATLVGAVLAVEESRGTWETGDALKVGNSGTGSDHEGDNGCRDNELHIDWVVQQLKWF